MKILVKYNDELDRFDIIGVKHLDDGADCLYGFEDTIEAGVNHAIGLLGTKPKSPVNLTYHSEMEATVEYEVTANELHQALETVRSNVRQMFQVIDIKKVRDSYDVIGYGHCSGGQNAFYGSRDTPEKAIELAKSVFSGFAKPDQLKVHRYSPIHWDVRIGPGVGVDAEAAKRTVDDYLARELVGRVPRFEVIGTTANVEDNSLIVDVVVTPFPAITSLNVDKLNALPGEKKFMDYFESCVEYPRNVAFNPLPLGELWMYISSTFLNAFINYVDIIDGWLLNRHHPMDHTFIAEEDGPFEKYRQNAEWVSPPDVVTKQQLFDLYTQKDAVYHTKLGMLKDDVLILSKCRGDAGKGMYIFFWFDQDNSDCGIGRFRTEDSEETVLELFQKYINVDLKYGGTPLPKSFFEGWLSF